MMRYLVIGILGICIFCSAVAAAEEGGEVKMRKLTLISLDEKATAHSYWFPYFLNKTDLEIMAKYRAKIAARLEKLPSDSVEGVDVTKVWAGSEELKEGLAATFNIPGRLDKWEDGAEGADGVVIIDTMSNGDLHAQIACYYLEKGVPVFVDKPFAPNMADAEKMIASARKTGTPLMSSSILRYVDNVAEVKNGLADAGKIRFIEAIGNGHTLQYGIHPLELLYGSIGPGVKRVRNSGDADTDVIHLDYKDGKEGVLMIFRKTKPNFQLTVYGESKIVTSEPVKVDRFDAGAKRMMETFAGMIKTKTPPIDYDEILEVMKVLTAAIESRENGGKLITLQ